MTAIARISFFLKDFCAYLALIILAVISFIVFLIWLQKSHLAIKTKKILVAIVCFCVSFIIIFSIFEAYFRYIYDQSDSLGYLDVNKRWFKRHVVYNNFFKRDRDFKEKTPGTKRICSLGDSITFGQGIDNPDDRFSNLLEHKLKANNFKAEVYNLGVPGLDTEDEIELYGNSGQLDCDIILWQYFPNDIESKNKQGPAKIIQDNGATGNLVKLITKKSTFSDFVYWRLSTKYTKTFSELDAYYFSKYGDAATLKKHEEDIKSFLDELKGQNKKVVVVIFPFMELLAPDYPATFIHEKLDSHFESQGVVVIDLLDDLKNSDSSEFRISHFDTHPNEKVHKIAAEKIYDKVEQILKDY